MKMSTTRKPAKTTSGNEGSARKKQNTAERFLDTAERLFAELGYEGTSTRAIANEAGVNLGALHYYWRTKSALYKAVLARRLDPMNNERLRRFDESEQSAKDGVADIRAVLSAFVEPAMHMGGTNPKVAKITRRLYHRMASDPSPDGQQLTAEIYGRVSERFIALLRPACAHLSDEEFYWRVQLAYGVVRFSQAGTPWIASISGGTFKGDNVDEGARYIVEALHAALIAPASARTGK